MDNMYVVRPVPDYEPALSEVGSPPDPPDPPPDNGTGPPTLDQA